MKRKAYLKKTSLDQAQQLLLDRFKNYNLNTEYIKTEKAQHRVTAKAVYAQQSAPDYYASAMDGIAVRAEKTDYASERDPVLLEKDKDFKYVDTGDLIPKDFDAVIKIEDVDQKTDQKVEIIKSVPPYNNIRSIGESVIKSQMIIPVHTKINRFDIGAMLEAGVTKVKVYKNPKLTIIPTGSELVDPGEKKERGQLVDFNSTMLKIAAQNWGCQVDKQDIVKDNYDKIKKRIIKANQSSDITIINAGSSAGREDYTLSILQELGEVFIHGVNIMPGKPLILAEVNKKPVIGIPGYPLSALLDFQLFVKPLINNILGLNYQLPQKIKAKLKKKLPSSAGLKEFIRVNLAEVAGEMLAVPQKRGSASMHSLINADGILPISENKEGIFSEDTAEVYILKPKEKIKKNLMMVGSHDLSLDIVRNLIKKNKYDFELNAQSVGSLSGIVALKRGECHLAGAHLLDTKTGDYNISYINNLLKGEKIAILNLVYRQQGLMVKNNNPQNIQGIEDLVREEVKFINRQRGSGTRVLLDYLIDESDLKKELINGYEKEEITHMSAAVQVAEGNADTALGIRAAAEACNIDFIPIKKEKYDLILREKDLEDERVKKVIEIIKSQAFKDSVNELGGYDTRLSGSVKII